MTEPIPYLPVQSAPQASNTFRVNANGIEQGPYPVDHVRHMVKRGELRATDPVSYAGQAWVPAVNAPGIYSDKSYITAVLLSFFLGTLGIDRFYLGNTGLGVAKLLLSWLTFGVWQLIDFILILMRKVPDAQGRPLR